jgi:hypothetical protein
LDPGQFVERARKIRRVFAHGAEGFAPEHVFVHQLIDLDILELPSMALLRRPLSKLGMSNGCIICSVILPFVQLDPALCKFLLGENVCLMGRAPSNQLSERLDIASKTCE